MKIVQRGNKQLRVADDCLEGMLKSGYVEVDGKTGRPLASPAAPGDSAVLRKENSTLRKENKELRVRVRELAEQVKALTARGTE